MALDKSGSERNLTQAERKQRLDELARDIQKDHLKHNWADAVGSIEKLKSSPVLEDAEKALIEAAQNILHNTQQTLEKRLELEKSGKSGTAPINRKP